MPWLAPVTIATVFFMMFLHNYVLRMVISGRVDEAIQVRAGLGK